MSPNDDALRLSDAERSLVVDALRRHTADGRLQLDEFEQRSATVFAAKTRADLRGILSDLPALPGLTGAPLRWAGAPEQFGPPPPPPVPPPPPPAWGWRQRQARWGAFWAVAAVLVAIWVASGMHYFWPAWVLIPWGLTLLFSRGGYRRRRNDRARPIPPGAA